MEQASGPDLTFEIIFFIFFKKSSSFNHEAAKVAVTKYIDYFGGKAIKMDLSGDEVDPRLYDRDAGEGAFARVVATLR